MLSQSISLLFVKVSYDGEMGKGRKSRTVGVLIHGEQWLNAE